MLVNLRLEGATARYPSDFMRMSSAERVIEYRSLLLCVFTWTELLPDPLPTSRAVPLLRRCSGNDCSCEKLVLPVVVEIAVVLTCTERVIFLALHCQPISAPRKVLSRILWASSVSASIERVIDLL